MNKVYCDICDKVFPGPLSLADHLREHRPKRPKFRDGKFIAKPVKVTRLSTNLRFLINKQSQSLIEIAAACGLPTKGMLSSWASGTTVPKATEKFVKLARFLGASIEDLITKEFKDK